MLSSISSGVLLTACFLGIQAVEAGELQKRVFQATPRQAASSNDISTSNSLLLSRTTSPGGVNSRSAAYALASSNSSNFTAGVLAHFNGESFSTTISWGNESFDVIIDTGSSDTWLVETGFTCLDYSNASVVDPENCAFGPTYNLTDTFKQIEGEHFNMSYADGEYITGIMGHELVTLGGLELNQTVGLVDVAAWNGDGFSSGLVGLSYPPLTSAFNGTDPDEDTEAGRINYDPIFVTAEKSGEIAPVFSLAIFRNVSGPAGYLTLGGLPPVDFEPGFISTPILITRVGGFDIDYDFYTINIEDILLNNASINGLFNTTCDNCTDSSAATTQYIVDSGTTLNYFPTAMANAINSAFSPPATYDENEGSYIVSCNATAPTLGITIAGKTFPTNALDMIIFTGTDENTGEDSCITGIMDGGEPSDDPLYILGDTFLKNVVAVFDVGAGEMRFAVHTDYESNDYV